MGTLRLEQDYRLDEQPHFMQKWEYMTYQWDFRHNFDDKLNELGQEGWEVIAGAGAGGDHRNDRIFIVLKRPC